MRGRGFGRGGTGGGRRGGRHGGSGGRQSSTGSYDPLACYRYGVRGHLARDCPQNQQQSQGSGISVPSRGRFSQSGQKGPRNRGRGRQTRFGAMGIVYDEEGYEYPIDDQGQLYVPYHPEEAAAFGETEEEKDKNTKN